MNIVRITIHFVFYVKVLFNHIEFSIAVLYRKSVFKSKKWFCAKKENVLLVCEQVFSKNDKSRKSESLHLVLVTPEYPRLTVS